MKKISDDVNLLVDHLKLTLGATWAAANVARAKKDTLLINPARTVGPWISVADLYSVRNVDIKQKLGSGAL